MGASVSAVVWGVEDEHRSEACRVEECLRDISGEEAEGRLKAANFGFRIGDWRLHVYSRAMIAAPKKAVLAVVAPVSAPAVCIPQMVRELCGDVKRGIHGGMGFFPCQNGATWRLKWGVVP